MREYRDYYAPKDAYPYTDGWTPAVLGIVVANVLVYVAMHIAVKAHWISDFTLYDVLAFVPERVAHSHRYWQLVTYAFLHDLGNPFHLLLNMYVLWLSGRELEYMYGKLRFVRFYLLAAVAGALVYAASTLPFGEDVGLPMLGASGAVMATLVLYAFYHPNDRLMLFFLFDMPVWVAVLLLIGLDVSMTFKLAPSHGVASACHLGGAAFGLLYWRYGNRAEALLERPPAAEPERPVPVRPGTAIRPPSLEDELDRVLEKLHATGMQSLTPDEKAVLDKASKHYRDKR